MDQSKWFFNTIIIFVFSLLALGMSLFLYIYWYIEVSAGLKSLIERFDLDPNQILASETWVVILVLSVLVAIILVGIFTIFVYNQKTLELYRLQRNFINSFTHELKTPVTSLSLYLETFEKYDLDRRDQVKYIRYMLSDIGRLSDTVTRILDLAKIESKKVGEQFVELDLVRTLQGFIEKNKHHFGGCRIELTPFEAGAIILMGNKTLLEMLFMNLLTNAVKYNKSVEPRVTIRFEVGKRKLRIEFEDNGIGFEKWERKKIFKKFYQIGRAEDMSAKGSGIGLHLVQNVARIHRGRVVAESKGLGEGSIFTLILPYAAKPPSCTRREIPKLKETR